MKISEFLERIYEEGEQEEILIEIDGTLYDFKIEEVPEQFDGFDTVYPAAYKLVPKQY